mmetsp:Transcript_83376/g.131655  ORF Transcript_83376/g.131655 Transcript_83376/m.131655 type:complete len:528 (+) Transcript_83376:83-1666(+)
MGRKKASPQTGGRSEFISEGLPSFCSARYFVPSSKVFVVPLWELPVNFECSLGSIEMKLSSNENSSNELQSLDIDHAPDCGHEDSEEEEFRDLVSYESFDDGTSLSSEISSASDVVDEFACIDPSWMRVMVDQRPVVFRRMSQSSQEALGSASCCIGFSTGLLPHALRRSVCEGVLDEYLLRELNGRQTQCAIFSLNSSGHFAGAVFDGANVVVHKTFHRYTSRAKQGGSQAAFDAQGKKAKSAGSNLRRYCQQRLGEEIRDLVTKQWASEIAACSRVFIAVPSRMRSMLIGTADQPYICPNTIFPLPFPIMRPTFEAVRAAYVQVSGVVFASQHVMQWLEGKHAVPERTPGTKRDSCDDLRTPLHAAAADGDEDRVIELLEGGADPTVKDSRGRVPFELCASRGVRRAFRFWFDLYGDVGDLATVGILRDSDDKEYKGKRRSKSKHKHMSSNLTVPPGEKKSETMEGLNCAKNEHRGQKGSSSSALSTNLSKCRKQQPQKKVARRQEAAYFSPKSRCRATLRRLAL